MILPTLVLCFKMGIEDQEFEDTWLGKMIAQMWFMKCKIFTGKDGYLVQGIAATPVKMEDAINKFLEQFEGETEHLRILQSQSGEQGNFVTITIFYWYDLQNSNDVEVCHFWWLFSRMGALGSAGKLLSTSLL